MLFNFLMTSIGAEVYGFNPRTSRFQPSEPPVQPQVTQTPTVEPEIPRVHTGYQKIPEYQPPTQPPYQPAQQYQQPTQPPYQPPVQQYQPPVQAISNDNLNEILDKLNYLTQKLEQQDKLFVEQRNFVVSNVNNLLQGRLSKQDVVDAVRASLPQQLTGNNNEQLILSVENLRQSVAEITDQLRNRLTTINDINSKMSDQTNTLRLIKSQVDYFANEFKNAMQLNKQSHEELSKTVVSNASFGFWTYFIFFQFIFFIGFAYWRFINSRRSHLL